MLKKITEHRIARFVIVGIANTLLNFAVLDFSYYVLKQSKSIAELIAIVFAVAFSFIMNRNFVFIDKHRPLKQLVLFICVTISGVILVQYTVYVICLRLLSGHETRIVNMMNVLVNIHIAKSFIDVNLSNAIAALCVMIWNYNGYRLLVFKSRRVPDDAVEII